MNAPQRFRDRREAGRRLAAALDRFGAEDPVVIGLARGGVPVAAEVARALGAPLDVVLVRKVGAPWQPELAIGAVAEGGVRVAGALPLDRIGIDAEQLDARFARAEEELTGRLRRFRGGQPAASLANRTVILVDDGLATGASALAAARSVRARGARRVVLAVPVAASEALPGLAADVDEIVALDVPGNLVAVGQSYEAFDATPDEEVTALLAGG